MGETGSADGDPGAVVGDCEADALAHEGVIWKVQGVVWVRLRGEAVGRG